MCGTVAGWCGRRGARFPYRTPLSLSMKAVAAPGGKEEGEEEEEEGFICRAARLDCTVLIKIYLNTLANAGLYELRSKHACKRSR